MHDQLRALIAQLRLHGMAEALDTELARADREAIAAPELLYRLLGQEAASRRERSLAYRLLQARLPWRWSLDSFPFDRQPGVSKAQIQTLAGLDFLRRADNVLLIGKPGTGKTGLGIGLLREACLNGYRGRFYNAQVLLDELYASLADRTTTKLLGQLSRMQPLFIDELGYLTIKPEQANAFFRTCMRCSTKSPWSMRCWIACSIIALPSGSTARPCAAPIYRRHRRPMRHAAPARADTRHLRSRSRCPPAPPAQVAATPMSGAEKTTTRFSGFGFPANEHRCAVLAPVKVRCSQASPCSL